jgi:Ser/Thr protein kinase RdoA (MazF antagonist)
METIKHIVDQYDWSEKEPVQLIRESADNKVYVVGDSQKTVIRVSKRLLIEDVQFEHECLIYLASAGVLVAPWITTTSGEIFTCAEDGSVVTAFGFVQGHHILVDKENLPTVDQAYAAGATLGLIAKAGEGYKTNLNRSRTIYTEFQRVLENKERFIGKFSNGQEFIDNVEAMVSFAKADQSSNGLIHNDFRAGNILFRDDVAVSAVLDFDWSCVGPLIKDAALGVLEWSFPDGATQHDSKIFDSFLNGYASTSGTHPAGKLLYQWIMFAALSDASTYFCDLLDDPESTKTTLSSYMYKKFKYFSLMR